jgi:hypothetical protein
LIRPPYDKAQIGAYAADDLLRAIVRAMFEAEAPPHDGARLDRRKVCFMSAGCIFTHRQIPTRPGAWG